MNLSDIAVNITADEIRRLRKKTNLTQNALAGLLGMGLSSWQRKELDKESPNYRPITHAELYVLLLLAGEHPDYILTKKRSRHKR